MVALCRLLSECSLEVLDWWTFFCRFDAFDGKGHFLIAKSSARAIATAEPLIPVVNETSCAAWLWVILNRGIGRIGGMAGGLINCQSLLPLLNPSS